MAATALSKKTRNKRLLAHNELKLKGQKGVIFRQVWHYKSTGTIIVEKMCNVML